MESEIRRKDEADPLALIETGKLHLQVLIQEAQAARAEAKRAELELALASAQAGNTEFLALWLSRHQGPDQNPIATQSPLAAANGVESLPLEPRRAEDAEAGATGIPSPRISTTWQTLAPHSQQRLQRTREQLAPRSDSSSPAVSPVPTLASKNRPTSSDAFSAPQKNEVEIVAEPTPKKQTGDKKQTPDELKSLKGESAKQESSEKLQAENRATAKEAPKKEAPKKLAQKDAKPKQVSPKQELVQLSKSFGDQQVLEQANKQRKMLLLSGVSGLGASLVAHVLVVIVLMIITLKMPDTVASLSFESSATESVETRVEITKPTEISATEVSPEMPTEVVSDVSESLAAVSSLSSDSLSESLPTPSSSLASSMSAASATAGASGKPNPAGANASFFGAAASGNSFCYVIDGSESMRGGPWEAAKAELLRSLGTLKEKQRFYIIFFNKELNAIPMPGEREPATQLLYATPENVKHARTWVESLRISPGAPPMAALKLAIEREPDAIYLLTDGETKTDVAGFLRKENRTSDFVSGEQVTVPIHSIAYYSLLGETLMRQIAAENKGQFIYVPKPGKR